MKSSPASIDSDEVEWCRLVGPLYTLTYYASGIVNRSSRHVDNCQTVNFVAASSQMRQVFKRLQYLEKREYFYYVSILSC